MDLIIQRLTECGWTEQVDKMCDGIKGEIGNMNEAEFLQQIKPMALSLVPKAVEKECLQEIEAFQAKQTESTETKQTESTETK